MSNRHSQKTFHPESQEPSSQKIIRSRNAAETRAALLAAARLRFARDGYEATNLRDIAADVGVNVALISRYFGSKAGLFQTVVAFDRDRIAQTMQGPPEQLGERLLNSVLVDPAGSDHDLFVTLLRSSDHPAAAQYMRNLLDLLTADLTSKTTLADADLRADLVAALLTGMVVLRRLLDKAPLADATADALLPYFQRILSVLLEDREAVHLRDK
jgi:AcrR family transcriptional regulator